MCAASHPARSATHSSRTHQGALGHETCLPAQVNIHVDEDDGGGGSDEALQLAQILAEARV
jgi:hypothetical protein